MTPSQQFLDAIASSGLTPPDDIQGDGKLHRFSSSGKRKDDAGWYVFHDDERPAGRFGCNRAGVDATWRADIKTEFTAEERAAWKSKMAAQKLARDTAEQEARQRAAATAADMWERAAPANGHAYLDRKGLVSSAAATSARELDGILLVPVKHGPKELVGLQRITPGGEKKFLHGTPAGGGYTTIGRPMGGPIVIVEGYATGLTVHLALGGCVVVAFNAGNLVHVAKKIRAAMPAAQLVIGADDDEFTEGNPGRTAAYEAAAAVGARVVFPIWLEARDRGTDFNDLHQAEGLQAVVDCFGEPEPGDEPDPEPETKTEPPAPAPGEAVMPQQQMLPALKHAPDYDTWLPNHNGKGKPLSTIDNMEEVARRLGVVIRYNVISKEEEILIPGQGFSMDNRQNASVAWITSEAAKFQMPTGNIGDFATYIAERNQFNPVVQWVSSTPWDGVDRLSQLVATVVAKDEDKHEAIAVMKRAFLTRWMISAIAAAFRPNGVSAHGVLVFQGDQYIGKTKWFKTLVPSEIGVLQDGVILRPEDRDSVKQCVSNWLVELGELDATFRKSDIAALKAFLTRDRDVLRRAYAKKESEFARRTVFFASVNPKEFLHDPTGNRRYWTIECEYLDHSHTIDMQQCWRQVYELWLGGEGWFLTPAEMDALNDHNKGFEVIDPIEELIRSGLNWDAAEFEWNWVSATDVLKSLGRDTPTLAEATRAAHVLRSINGKRSRKANGARQLFVPDKKWR